jgi:hypothetical protein
MVDLEQQEERRQRGGETENRLGQRRKHDGEYRRVRVRVQP